MSVAAKAQWNHRSSARVNPPIARPPAPRLRQLTAVACLTCPSSTFAAGRRQDDLRVQSRQAHRIRMRPASSSPSRKVVTHRRTSPASAGARPRSNRLRRDAQPSRISIGSFALADARLLGRRSPRWAATRLFARSTRLALLPDAPRSRREVSAFPMSARPASRPITASGRRPEEPDAASLRFMHSWSCAVILNTAW